MSRLVRPDVNTSGVGFSASPVTVRTAVPGAPVADAAAPAGTVQVDNYTTRIVKYIPAEVIAFYVAADKLFQTGAPIPADAATAPAPPGTTAPDVITVLMHKNGWWFSLAVFLIGFVGVPIYYRMAAEKNQPWITNTVIAMIAYVIWTYATQGTVYFYKGTVYYNPTLASFLLLVFTFAAGFIVPGRAEAPQH